MRYRRPFEALGAPFLVCVRIEDGVARLAVEGRVDGSSAPVVLEEIRHAATLIKEELAECADQSEARWTLQIDLTEVERLEEQAERQILALVRQLQADDVAVGIVRRSLTVVR
jgi:anti-anti-sigma regulatory factor